jgi:hypothetical protein
VSNSAFAAAQPAPAADRVVQLRIALLVRLAALGDALDRRAGGIALAPSSMSHATPNFWPIHCPFDCFITGVSRARLDFHTDFAFPHVGMTRVFTHPNRV